MGKTLVEMAAEIVQSQCGSTNMNTNEIALALQNTYNVLQSLQQNESKGDQATNLQLEEIVSPVVDVKPEKSILKNKIICLECGQEFKILSPKHLKSHGLTGKEYRVKYSFSTRQPLCAKSLSERRKKSGKERGLPANLKKAISKRKKSRSTK